MVIESPSSICGLADNIKSICMVGYRITCSSADTTRARIPKQQIPIQIRTRGLDLAWHWLFKPRMEVVWLLFLLSAALSLSHTELLAEKSRISRMLLLRLCCCALSLNLKPGPLQQQAVWSSNGQVGSSRFSKRLQLPMSIAGIFRSPVTYATRL